MAANIRCDHCHGRVNYQVKNGLATRMCPTCNSMLVSVEGIPAAFAKKLMAEGRKLMEDRAQDLLGEVQKFSDKQKSAPVSKQTAFARPR